MASKTEILEAAITQFQIKGIKFTQADVAAQAGISKKTIYQYFKSKDEMFLSMVEYVFEGIKERERQIAENPNLSTVDKIYQIVIALPDRYENIEQRHLYDLQTRYPQLYHGVVKHLESDWELTIALLERGMEEGVIRKFSIPVLKMMIEASIAHFLDSDKFESMNLTYHQALEEMMSILMEGICIEKI